MKKNNITGTVIFFLSVLLTCGIISCKSSDKKKQEEKITILSEATKNIGTKGGELSLPDGIKLVVEPGTLNADNSITISLVEADKYFGNDAAAFTVIQCNATQKEFSKPVTIQIPVPKQWQSKVSLDAAGGEIDEATGIIKTLPTELKDINGVKTLLIQTTHFSTYAGWFWETPPLSVVPMEIPFYRQGSASTCWAACIQMLCEGVKHKPFHEVFDILKKVGYTDGVSPAQFKFFSSAISHMRIYTDATAVTEYWQYNSAEGLTKAIKHHIALGHPVMLLTTYSIMTTKDGHAVIITGYDGGRFFVHDPANISATGVGYQSVATADLVKIDFGNTNAATITAIPATVSPPGLVSLSPEENTIRFTAPKKAGSVQEETYNLKYNTAAVNGYSFNSGTGVIVDTIPATVTKLVIKDLPVTNASRSVAKTASVDIFISGPPKSKINKSYNVNGIQVGPNSVVHFTKEIDLADLQNKGTEYIKYSIKVSVRTGGSGDDDEFIIDALMAPPDPLTGDWHISSTVKSSSDDPDAIGKVSTIDARFTVNNNSVIIAQRNDQGESDKNFVVQLQRKPGDIINFVLVTEGGEKDSWRKITISGKMTGPDSWTATQKIEGGDITKKRNYVILDLVATRQKNP
ncbi:MAG: C39 family peptidase [Chitinophagaceae bacterium]